MGQFLALGLTRKIFTPLENLRKNNVTTKDLQQEIQRTLYLDMNLYDEEEADAYLVFTLKDHVLETGLIPFLEAIYPLVCKDPEERGYPALLKQLHATSPAEWMDAARAKRNYAFQMDEYAEPRFIRIPKGYYQDIQLRFHCVILHHGYGKIITEGIYDFTNFFNHCIHETFKDHPLAKSVQVYITG